MAWSNLQSNQMVSFTDAQTSGATLKSGQSHVTSNQCMTKSEALAKYNLDANAMSSYASNQLVPKSAWVSAGLQFLVTAGSGAGFRGYTAGIFGSIAVAPANITFAGAGAVIKGVYTTDSTFYLEIFNGSNSVQPSGWNYLSIGNSELQFNRVNTNTPPYTVSNDGKWVYKFDYPIPFIGTNFFLSATITPINIR